MKQGPKKYDGSGRIFFESKIRSTPETMSGEDGIQGNEFRMLMSRMMLFTEQLPIPHNLIVSSPTWVS